MRGRKDLFFNPLERVTQAQYRMRDEMMEPFVQEVFLFEDKARKIVGPSWSRPIQSGRKKQGPRRDGTCTYMVIFDSEKSAQALYDVTKRDLVYEGVQIPVQVAPWRSSNIRGDGKHRDKNF